MAPTPTSHVSPLTPTLKAGLESHLTRLGRVLITGTDRKPARVTINPHAGVCATDGKSVTMDYPVLKSARNDTENLVATEAVMAHEAAGHLRYTNFNAWKRVADGIKRGDEDRLLHDITNIVEDRRVNHLLSQDFPGSKKRLDWTQQAVLADHREMMAATPPTEKDAPRFAVIALATEVILAEPHIVGLPSVIAFMDEVRPLIKPAIAQKNTGGVIKAAREILAVFRTHFPADSTDGKEYGAPGDAMAEGMFADDMTMENVSEAANNQRRDGVSPENAPQKRFKEVEVPTGSTGENPSSAPSEGEEEGEGSSGASEGEDGSEGASQGDSEGGPEGESGDGGGEGDEGAPGIETDDGSGSGSDGETTNRAAGRDFMDSQDLVIGGDGDGGPSNAGRADLPANLLRDTDLSWEAIETGEVMEDAGQASADQQVWDKVMGGDVGAGRNETGHDIRIEAAPQPHRNATEQFDQVVKENRAGIRRLVRTLTDFTKGRDERFTSHKKRGGLDTSRLWASGTSERVFRKRVEKQAPKVSAVILIDASGSMGGSRSVHAAKAASVLAQALEDFGATYEVVDFNSDYNGGRSHRDGATLIRVRKGARASLSSSRAAIRTPYAGSQNADGHAVRWSINRTAAMGERGAHRLVFVISDGQPAGPAPRAYERSASRHLHGVLKEAMSEDVTVFSVGIAGMNPAEYYSPYGHGNVAIPRDAPLASAIIMPLKVALKTALKGARA